MQSSESNTIKIHENKCIIVAAIIPFSIAGLLVRIALTRLETYVGSPVFSLVYSQWVGCFIMGVAQANKNIILRRMYPLFSGITSGLCGSITTFSSWQLQIFQEFTNYYQHPHNRGKNVLAAISIFLVTLAMSWQAFTLGKQVALNQSQATAVEIQSHGYTLRRPLRKQDYGLILFGLASWMGVICAAIWASNQRSLSFGIVFAPFGALLRYNMSFFNFSSRFPIGTFIVNVFGTLILAVLFLLQIGVISTTKIQCDLIQGLADGFCGCLTTVSTFVVELNSLGTRDGYLYGIASVLLSQGVLFATLGPFIWSHDIHNVCMA